MPSLGEQPRGLALLSLALSACVAAAWVVLQPATADLAAQVYRAQLFQRAGWSLLDTGWFGGQSLLAYSLLTPQLMATLGVGATGLLASAVTTVAFARIAREVRPERWVWATAWVAWAATADLLVGRITYAVGQALAVLAVLALLRRRGVTAVVLAACAAAASPVAGAFLGLAAIVWWWVDRRPGTLATAASAGGVTLAVAVLFGDAGSQPYSTAGAALAVLLVLTLWNCVGRDERLARYALGAYGVAVVASWALPTAMGSNVARLGVAFAVPVALLARRRVAAPALGAAAVAAAGWLAFAPVTEVGKAIDARAGAASYYRPLLAELRQRGAAGQRIEVVPSATRWEAVYVPAQQPLARGWATQLDRARNPLFYAPDLTAGRYLRWLRGNAVQYVALSSAPRERWGRREQTLLEHGVAGLRPVWSSGDWRLYAVTSAELLATGGRVRSLRSNAIHLAVPRAGTVILRVRWSPYWTTGPGSCIRRRADGFMDVVVQRPGNVQLSVSAASLVQGQPPCSPGRTR